jgi:hypothetical protein
VVKTTLNGLGDDFSICIIYLGFDQTTKGIWSITMPDMINPQKGIDLTNNNSIINRILFAVTIFQQVWGNGLGQSFFLRITLSSGQEEWSASSGSHSFKVHSCELLRFGYLGKWSPCAYESLSTKGEDYYPHTLLYDSNFTLT